MIYFKNFLFLYIYCKFILSCLKCHPVPEDTLCETRETGRELDLLVLRGVASGADHVCPVHILN